MLQLNALYVENLDKQNAFTLYPNSAKVAAAEPPAKPVPTTITSILRLFAGFTKIDMIFIIVHLSLIGPLGTFESKLPYFILMS